MMAAPKQRAAKQPSAKDGGLPSVFKRPPPSLDRFLQGLSPRHIYIVHLDTKPADFKRNIFLVTALAHIVLAVMIVYRAVLAGPYYFGLATALLGDNNETVFPIHSSTWEQTGREVLRRAANFLLDFLVFGWVAPMMLAFVASRENGNPTTWRWKVGFRDREICVRRSRDWYKAPDGGDVVGEFAGRWGPSSPILERVTRATSAELLAEKTSYALMGTEWLLDFNAMVKATEFVDKKEITLDEFKLLVLLRDKTHGWLVLDTQSSLTAAQDQERGQMAGFRDALAAEGKEDLFYRWVEVMQFESTRPGGFGPSQQSKAAAQVREMFSQEGINFDEIWAKSVGPDHGGRI